MPHGYKVPRSSGDRVLPKRLQGHDVEGALMSAGQHHKGRRSLRGLGPTQVFSCGRHTADERIGDLYPPRWVLVSGILCCNQATSREESQRWSRHVPKRRTT